ncbi:MAG: class I SAM-dependent methyltransferase [Dialister sp.]|nr:class I SAM-dependent methyltransferase [Dialister sp.]
MELVKKLDYDFSKFQKATLSQSGCAARSAILDRETKRFRRNHAHAVCINLCAGLDTRFYRVNRDGLDWYNIDLPNVIRLRAELLPEETDNVHNVAGSILEADTFSFKEEVSGRPVLLIMEGASMYFTEEEMRRLLKMLQDQFPRAVMLMEVMPPFLIRHQKHHDSVGKYVKARFIWGVTDGKELEQLVPSIRFCRQWTFYEGVRRRWGVMGLLSFIPWWNYNVNDKIIQLEL